MTIVILFIVVLIMIAAAGFIGPLLIESLVVVLYGLSAIITFPIMFPYSMYKNWTKYKALCIFAIILVFFNIIIFLLIAICS